MRPTDPTMVPVGSRAPTPGFLSRLRWLRPTCPQRPHPLAASQTCWGMRWDWGSSHRAAEKVPVIFRGEHRVPGSQVLTQGGRSRTRSRAGTRPGHCQPLACKRDTVLDYTSSKTFARLNLLEIKEGGEKRKTSLMPDCTKCCPTGPFLIIATFPGSGFEVYSKQERWAGRSKLGLTSVPSCVGSPLCFVRPSLH